VRGYHDPDHPVRAIVSDVDGTLTDPQGIVPEANRIAFQTAAANGIRLALATVRKYDTAMQIVKQLGVPCALVGEAGAAIYDEAGTLLHCATLPWEVAIAVAELADTVPFGMAMTLDGENYFGPGYRPSLLVGTQSCQVPSHRAALDRAPTRLIIQDPEAVVLVRRTFADAPIHVVHHYRSDGSLIDGVMTHARATKEDGIERLLAHWELNWCDVMAIGDAEADLQMIQRAGLGVAVGNARPEVLAAAQLVTGPAAEAGVAQAIGLVLERQGFPSSGRRDV
jgi:Cof subfamily protein (haloacid dehalogenase superfamily)